MKFIHVCQHTFHCRRNNVRQVENGAFVILICPIFGPVNQHTGQRFGVKLCGICFELRLNGDVGLRFCFVDYGSYDLNKVHIKEPLHFLTANGVMGAADNIIILTDVVHYKAYGGLVIFQQVKVANDLYGLFVEYPLEQVVNILKMIVEGLAVVSFDSFAFHIGVSTKLRQES